MLEELDDCQIYLTPYPNLQQSTSGTLSYAVALGKAVISTPYIHASELLEDGCGLLFPPGNSDALAAAILELAHDRHRLDEIRRRAYARGRKTIWSEFVANVDTMLVSAMRGEMPILSHVRLRAVPGLVGFRVMVDGTGMLQHSHGPVSQSRPRLLCGRQCPCLDANEYGRHLFPFGFVSAFAYILLVHPGQLQSRHWLLPEFHEL